MFSKFNKKKMVDFFSLKYKGVDSSELIKISNSVHRSWVKATVIEWILMIVGIPFLIAPAVILFSNLDLELSKKQWVEVIVLGLIGLLMFAIATPFFLYAKYQRVNLFSLDMMMGSEETSKPTKEEAIIQICNAKTYSYSEVANWQTRPSNVATIYAIHALNHFKVIDKNIPLFIGLADDLFSTWKQQIEWINEFNRTKKTTHQKIVQIIQWLQDHNLTINDLSFSSLEENVRSNYFEERLNYWIVATGSNFNGWNKALI